MKNDIPKTNAMRILEKLGIPYTTVTYSWSEDHLDAVHASQTAGLDPGTVFKTIVMRDTEKNIFVFCVPAAFSVNPKKARQLTGSHELTLVKLDELQRVTGYIRGGCSPIGMKKQFPTFIEEVALVQEKIYVSAGVRGVQLGLSPQDLQRATSGHFADLSL
ncbi:Cys-tRNA(Pro) deacylase [Parasphaerochaeta coccoides]|uniref:Cys-tRNA(Pro)/Cys-tRNA(Cys) deacylase n=1 Tax=Parasphaerochaeta coccoides (strain ATCC BAA-1237 / DSM 17374 / SPN1) TaxID=760011 RepID=F4GJI7_PARC1|nr:Cys-tRNA(Pro) deacylase [Parasphaerochaeta coccoides]AEC02252.1 ybaK/ebsC protein [Parasphaerochaeta coccoides DSM 17374]